MEKIDRRRTTFDCGAMANFLQDSRASANDTSNLTSMLDYCGTIQDIIKVGFRQFSMFIFDVQWFKVICNGPNARVRRDPSGFFAIESTKLWMDVRDTFVLPQQCEEVNIFHT